jgi:hypothetical protein
MQQGSIIKAKRKSGLDVWEFRWREPGPVLGAAELRSLLMCLFVPSRKGKYAPQTSVP